MLENVFHHILTFFLQPAEEKEALLQKEEYQEEMLESTFLYLTLDLPTAPLYKDEKEQLIIPQVPLFNILAKFNGITEKVSAIGFVLQSVLCTVSCEMSIKPFICNDNIVKSKSNVKYLCRKKKKKEEPCFLIFHHRSTKPTKRTSSKGSS